MIFTLIAFGKDWLNSYWILSVQNFLFLSLIFVLLFLLRKKSARILKAISLVGLFKLLVPPFLHLPFLDLPSLAPDVMGLQAAGQENISPFSLPDLVPLMLMVFWLMISGFIFFTALWRYYLLKRKLTGLTAFTHHNLTFFRPAGNADTFKSPFVMGIIKPIIVIPVTWSRDNRSRFISAYYHEICHIAELDRYINLFKLAAFAFHFINPMVWILMRRLDTYSEMVCDDFAISHSRTSSRDYIDNLLSLAEPAGYPKAIPVQPSFLSGRRILQTRINYLLHQKEDVPMKKLNRYSWALIITLVCAVIPFSLTSGGFDESRSALLSTAPEDSLVSIDLLDEAPVLVHQGIPKYPEEARKAKIQGTVIVEATLGLTGKVEKVKVIQSVKELDEVAVKAAEETTFKPVRYKGKAVKVNIKLPFNFKLN